MAARVSPPAGTEHEECGSSCQCRQPHLHRCHTSQEQGGDDPEPWPSASTPRKPVCHSPTCSTAKLTLSSEQRGRQEGLTPARQPQGACIPQ